MTDSKITNNGANIILDRIFKSVISYTVPSVYKVGIGSTDPTVSDTDLTVAVPISDGTTNDDGSNTLTGSSGGDNSTNNTTTFKQGGGNTDVTAQNLISNGTSATKTWTIANLAAAGTVITATEPFGLWLYIADATTLAYFKDSGTAVQIRLGSEINNYYSKSHSKPFKPTRI